MAETDTADPAAAFAGLMSSAADAAGPADGEDAPYGYTTDPDGTRRPKKAAGRPRRSPSVDELKADRDQAPPAEPPPGDRAPARERKRGRRRGPAEPKQEAEGTPQHRPGVITKGVNRLYRRAGKIVRAMDRDIGIAIIESARNTAEDGEPDDSVGAAWDELARTNPRIRRFLLKMIAGGAWGQVLMAHAPILLAIVMKDGIAKHIPFMKLITAMADDDDEAQAEGEIHVPGGLFAGMKPEDMQQMAEMGQQMMTQMAGKLAAGEPGPAGERHGRVA